MFRAPRVLSSESLFVIANLQSLVSNKGKCWCGFLCCVYNQASMVHSLWLQLLWFSIIRAIFIARTMEAVTHFL